MMKRTHTLWLIGLMAILLIPALAPYSLFGLFTGQAQTYEAGRLSVRRNDNVSNSVILQWEEKTGAVQYTLLKSSQRLGWRGDTTLTAPAAASSDTISIANTAGLEIGAELTLWPYGYNTIRQIIDNRTLQLSYPLSSQYAQNANLYLSGAWIKDYSGYSQIVSSGVPGEYTDTGLMTGTDYFYVVRYTDGAGSVSYSNPVNAQFNSSGTLLWDAALGSNGGYAWDSYSDIDKGALIDGDLATSVSVPSNNPDTYQTSTAKMQRGFIKLSLAGRVMVEELRITQAGGYAQAKAVSVMTDDGTVFNYDISSDLRPGWSDKSVSHLPLNKATSFLNIYCDEFNSVAYGPFWFAINVYTADPQPVLENSAVTLSRASVIVDFTQNDGVLPRGFASTNTQSFVGVPDGWEYDGLDMFKPLATQFHRTYIGEDWPHNWGADLIEVGVLANAADGSQSFLALTDAKPVMLWTTLKVDKEHLMPTSITGNIVTVKRGENGTHIVPHVSGTKVYQFHNVGQVNRATELLPEFRRVRYDRAQASNLFDTDTQLNVSSGSFSAGDVIQIEAELMKVTSVNAQTLAVTRGFDGTDRVTHWAGNNIYKILNYSPVYTQSPLDAGDPQNYTWDYWDRHFDGIVLDLQAIPWVYTACPQYMFYSRGTVTSVSSNILQDSSKDWWAPDSYQAQFKNGTAYILDGNAAGKVFYVLTSGVNTLQLADINTMQPVDLVSQGVRIGDHFKVKPNGGLSPALLAPTKEHWQRYVDYWYMIMDHLTARYPQSEFYLEFWCEPNIYGNWTGDIYCELYKKFSATLRTGGVNFENPIPRIKIGAGSSSTGFMFGFGGNYEYYERLIKDCPYINFVSQHRYGDGLRMDKRRFAWESAFLKKIARKSGKEIEIFDSENTYCAGMIGTGREVASHNAYGEVSYWGNAFVKYFYGDHGADGRYRGIFQFLLLSHDEVNGFGLFANGKIAPSFWPIKLFAENTTPAGGDIFAKTLCGGDAYGWVQTMAYSTPEGAKKIWIANKKPSPIIINLSLPGSSATAAKMDSCIGSGPYQTIDDGYQPFGYAGKGGNGVVRSVRLTDLSNIVLEPHSANAITLEDSAIFYGDPSGDGSIDAYDAALVAKHSVGLITLSPEQQQKAEVSGDGLIDAYDAALIAKRAVGLIDKFPVEQ